jgi:hypothetical protein
VASALWETANQAKDAAASAVVPVKVRRNSPPKHDNLALRPWPVSGRCGTHSDDSPHSALQSLSSRETSDQSMNAGQKTASSQPVISFLTSLWRKRHGRLFENADDIVVHFLYDAGRGLTRHEDAVPEVGLLARHTRFCNRWVLWRGGKPLARGDSKRAYLSRASGL